MRPERVVVCAADVRDAGGATTSAWVLTERHNTRLIGGIGIGHRQHGDVAAFTSVYPDARLGPIFFRGPEEHFGMYLGKKDCAKGSL